MELVSNLQPKQVKAARYWLDDETEELLFGGAKGGSKSYLGCSLIFGDALTYPGTHYFIARHDLNDLTKHTTPSINEVFEHWGIDPLHYMRFNGKDNYFLLNNGSRVYYIDCKHLPRDPDYHRFGSLQFTRGWCEEVGQIPDKALQNLSVSVGRWKNNDYKLKRKLLLTCNPNKGYAYREFFLPHEDGTIQKHRKFVKSLPSDNKYLSAEYIEALNRLPKDMRARLMYGDWRYDDDPTKLCEFDKIMDLWSNTHVQVGKRYISCDVARFGRDMSVIMCWDGLRLIEIKTIAKSDLTHLRDVILSLKKKHNVPMSHVIIDSDGVGGGVVDMLQGCQPFQANKKPVAIDTRQNYANLKSQLYFLLADYINNAKIWIRPEENKDKIIEELEQIKREKDLTDDKLRVVKKEHIKELLGRSPDYSDAMMMRLWYEIGMKDYFG